MKRVVYSATETEKRTIMSYIPREYRHLVVDCWLGDRVWNDVSQRWNTLVAIEWASGEVATYQNKAHMQAVLKEFHSPEEFEPEEPVEARTDMPLFRTEFPIEVIPECNDEDDNPTCWGVEMTDNAGKHHWIWITLYEDDGEVGYDYYQVEDSRGNNLTRGAVFKTFAGAKKRAFEVAKWQEADEFFTD